MFNFLAAMYPEAKIFPKKFQVIVIAVELKPAIARMAREYFDLLESVRHSVVVADAVY